MYDLVLKGGMVIEPAKGIHEIRDVAVKNGMIADVAYDIPTSEIGKVIPVTGRIVTPGLIDLHCHPGTGVRRNAVDPDEIGVYSGVTTLCDGGTTGAANFHQFRKYAIEHAKTDIFCFLNMSLTGLVTKPEIRAEYDIDPEMTRQVIEENLDVIKGIKLRALSPLAKCMGIRAIEIAKKLSTTVKLPLMLHIGEPRDRLNKDFMDNFTREAVRLMEKGDILSHFMTWGAGGLILSDGTVYPELLEAKKRGVLLDSCHGSSSFSFSIASHAIRQGLLPTVISTDLGRMSLSSVQSLLITMSKFLNLGLTIDQVVQMTTTNPAEAIGEESGRGSLKTGIPADVTVMEIVQGEYLFSDCKGGGKLQGTHILEPRLVLKDGVEMPCLSRYQIPPVYTEK
jgi:dihydroorotase